MNPKLINDEILKKITKNISTYNEYETKEVYELNSIRSLKQKLIKCSNMFLTEKNQADKLCQSASDYRSSLHRTEEYLNNFIHNLDKILETPHHSFYDSDDNDS